MGKSLHEYLTYFTQVQISQMHASSSSSWTLEVSRKTLATRDAPENQDSWNCNENSGRGDPHSSFQDPASICQRTVASTSCLPALAFSLMPSAIPLCSQQQWLGCRFKEAQLQRKEMAHASTLLCVPGAICRSSSQEREERPCVCFPLTSR